MEDTSLCLKVTHRKVAEIIGHEPSRLSTCLRAISDMRAM